MRIYLKENSNTNDYGVDLGKLKPHSSHQLFDSFGLDTKDIVVNGNKLDPLAYFGKFTSMEDSCVIIIVAGGDYEDTYTVSLLTDRDTTFNDYYDWVFDDEKDTNGTTDIEMHTDDIESLSEAVKLANSLIPLENLSYRDLLKYINENDLGMFPESKRWFFH